MPPTGGDATLLSGLHELVNPQNIKHGINYEEIERGLISNGEINTQKDPNELFKSELSDLAKTLGLDFNSPRSDRNSPRQKQQSSNSPRRDNSFSSPVRDPYESARRSARKSSPLANNNSYTNEDEDDEHDGGNGGNGGNDGGGIPAELSSLLGISNGSSRDSPRSSRNQNDEYSSARSPSRNSPSNMSPRPQSSPFRQSSPAMETEDEQEDEEEEAFPGFNYSSPRKQTEFTRRTDEEYRHEQVKSVMSSMGGDDSKFISLDEANKEDEKTIMLEEIDSLRATLEEEEAKGIDKIPAVSQDDDYAVVENVLRRLRLKNDRARYTGLADEFLLWGAQCVEQLFDGKRAWFGKNPDLTGWSKEVQVKLRRMHHDTSTLVSGVMHDYNIGPGMRIMLELVPNFFMYARRRKQNYGKANIYSDGDIAQHMSSIRNIDD